MGISPLDIMATDAERAAPAGRVGAPAISAQRRRWARLRPRLGGVAFVLPAVVLLALFLYAPLVQAVRYSFTNWDGISPAKYVGVDNYRTLLHSGQFHRIMLTEFVMVCGIVVWIAVPFALAVSSHGMKRAGRIRTVLFIPALLPPIIAANIFRLVLADDGPLTKAMHAVGLGGLMPGWLTSSSFVLVSVIGVMAWALMGGGVLFYSAALTSMPTSREESARIDGASWWQLVWHIYRPHLRPVTRFWTLILIALTVTAFFPWIYGLTRGGPGVASTTLDYDVYQTGIGNSQQGLAAAIGVVNIVVVAVLFTLIWVLRKLAARDE